MSFMRRLGEFLVPDWLELKVSSYFQKRGIYEVPYVIVARTFLINIGIALIVFLLTYLRWLRAVPIAGLLMLFLLTVVIVMVLSLLAYIGYYDYLNYKRTEEIEHVLPEYLSLVASNLRSGMTIDKSLWTAASPKFGVLSEEIKKAAKQVATGIDVEKTLFSFADKYNSIVLDRAIDLIVEGMASGGELAEVIEKVVENIEQQVYLRKELQAASLAYVIFISVIVLVISPFLFALSHNLLIIITRIGSRISIPQGAQGFGAISVLASITNIAITPADFQNFAVIAIVIIALFSSMIISIINKESIMAGIKYIPLFIACSLLAFFFLSGGLAAIFAGFI